MRPEHEETQRERLGDAAIAVLALLILMALLWPGWSWL